MRFSKTTTSVEKCFVRFLSGEGIFFAMNFGEAGPARNKTNIFRDGSRRSRWEDRFYSGLNPVVYSVLSRQQRQRRRWRSCIVMLLFSPPSFSMSPSRFLCPFYPFFFFFPSCNLSLGFRSLGSAHDAYTAGKVLSWKWNVVISSRGLWLYRRVVKTAKGNRLSMENFSRRR